MSSSDSSPWREKYLQLLDDQELQQQQFEQDTDTLRRALIRVSLASEGVDADLDRAMKHLREQLRQGQSSNIARVMDESDAAILAFEKRREQEQASLKSVLDALIEKVPLNGSPKLLQRQLGAAVANQQALSGWLQGLVDQLTADPAPRPGLFERLLGLKKQTAVDAPIEADSVSPTESGKSDMNSLGSAELQDSEPVFIPEPAAKAEPSVLVGQFQAREEVAGDEPEAVFQRPVFEPEFSRISDKLVRVLVDLLDNIEPVACVVTKSNAARLRIARGLNWYELVPTLEDIRDLIMQTYVAAGEEYGRYLREVDAALLEISKVLGVVLADQQQMAADQQAMDKLMDEQVSVLGAAVAHSEDLQTLKQQVSNHIDTIQQALNQRQSRASGSAVAEQLMSLAAQISTMENEARQTRAALEEQRQKALTDALTELPNREAYNEKVHQEFNRWQRYQRPLTLAVCDIDFFKRINDSFGHLAGDRVLKVLALGVSRRLRDVDFIARYGGEEFVILLPETSIEQAMVVLDKIRDSISRTPFHFKEQPVKITLSMGIAEFSNQEKDTIESVFALADARLYQAKQNGRNCCVHSGSGVKPS